MQAWYLDIGKFKSDFRLSHVISCFRNNSNWKTIIFIHE